MRRHELDGLRAVAATMVVLFHCVVAVASPHPVTAALRLGLPGALANGASAVILFFVLSGFVLAGSFRRDLGPAGTAGFLLRRVLRLLPAWMIAVLLTWLASFLYAGLPRGAGLSSSMQNSLAVHLDGGQLLRSLLLPGTAYGQVPQGWTLALELQFSLALPALVFVATRLRPAALVAFAAAGLVLSDWPVIQYGFPFALGVALAAPGRAGGNGRPLAPVVVAVATIVAAVAFLLPPSWLWPLSKPLGIAVASAGASALVWLAGRPGWLQALLTSRPLARIGEVSYGLYLLHFGVVCLAAPFVLGATPAADQATAGARWLALAAVVWPVSLALAFASWRWVERPSIAAGRWLSSSRGRRPEG